MVHNILMNFFKRERICKVLTLNQITLKDWSMDSSIFLSSTRCSRLDWYSYHRLVSKIQRKHKTTRYIFKFCKSQISFCFHFLRKWHLVLVSEIKLTLQGCQNLKFEKPTTSFTFKQMVLPCQLHNDKVETLSSILT